MSVSITGLLVHCLHKAHCFCISNVIYFNVKYFFFRYSCDHTQQTGTFVVPGSARNSASQVNSYQINIQLEIKYCMCCDMQRNNGSRIKLPSGLHLPDGILTMLCLFVTFAQSVGVSDLDTSYRSSLWLESNCIDHLNHTFIFNYYQ